MRVPANYPNSFVMAMDFLASSMLPIDSDGQLVGGRSMVVIFRILVVDLADESVQSGPLKGIQIG